MDGEHLLLFLYKLWLNNPEEEEKREVMLQEKKKHEAFSTGSFWPELSVLPLFLH